MNKQMLKTAFKAFGEMYSIIPVYTVLLFVTAAIAIGVNIGNTYVMSRLFDGAYDVYAGEMVRNTFLIIVAVYLGLYLLGLAAGSLYDFIMSYGFRQIGNNFIRIRTGEKTAKLNLVSLEDPEVLNLIERARSTAAGEKIPYMMQNFFRRTLISAFSLVGIIVVLASFSLWLVPIAVLSCVPTLIAKMKRGNRFYNLKKAQIPQVRTLEYFWRLFLSPVHIREMRVLGFGNYLSDKWAGVNTEVNEATWNFQKRDAGIMFLLDVFRIFCYITGIVLSVAFVYYDIISVGQFGACIAAFLAVQLHMINLAVGLSSAGNNLPYTQDYYKFLAMPTDDSGEKTFGGINDKIELKDISFRYPNAEKQALQGINLTIKKGETIALIGENGSGKTTLSKILLGLFPPENGTLHIDGAQVTDFDRKSFYKHFSMVSQNFVRYCMLLRENVALGDIEQMNDDAKIILTLERAEIEETIEKTGGLDGMLGREFDGAELSGGQWQKLAIARGLFKNYDFIVLDEPTSALDPLVETEIFKKFIEAMDNKTALIISHRVGLCRMVDRIVVLQDGQISEVGNHNELMEKKGHYYELFTSQQMWYV